MHLYRISGLTIASEIVLPGAWPLDCGTPDVVMRQGAVGHTLPNPLASSRIWQADDDHFLLRADGVGRFLLVDGNTIIFEPDTGIPAAECAVYLQGTAIGMLLNQRGGIVLHASAAEVDGQAVLFCGASGEGKSTLVATLSSMGYAMVSDDVSLITFDAAGQPFVSADARQLKLTNEAIQMLGLEGRQGSAVLGGAAKAYVSPPTRWSGGDLPIRAIYLLRSTSIASDSIAPLDNVTALQQLSRHAHRPGLMRRTGLSARYFEAGTKIIRHAGMFTFCRQHGISRLRETAAVLEKHWGVCRASCYSGSNFERS